MKVLWFANTSSGYNQERLSHHYYGGGWISSLEYLMADVKEIDLAVSFFHPEDDQKCKQGNTTYYPILRKKGSYARRFYNNWMNKLESEADTKRFLDIVEDFQPDIIQIFGTEGPFASIQSRTKIPIVIHIQGIINPYLNAWYPPGISGSDVFFKASNLLDIIKANGKWFGKRQFIKRGARERIFFSEAKHLMGRTTWVKDVADLVMPEAQYFEVNEVLRPIFYNGGQWKPKENKKIKIVSTISSSTYKGLDQVLKCAYILKNIAKKDFEWVVCGLSCNDGLVKLMEKKFKIKFEENNVSFLGAIPSEKIKTILLDSDLYVHPSYIETGCISIAEAQILAVPVIACYVGGLTTTVDNNNTGILVAANDPYGMAAKIIMLCSDKQFATQIGIKAKKIAEERHDKKKIVTEILRVYKEITQSPTQDLPAKLQLDETHTTVSS